MLTDLVPCQSYLISVGIVGPKGPGPLSRPISYDTKYNEDRPPRNVDVTLDAVKHEMLIQWEHNCPMGVQYPSSYLITLTELTHNKTAIVKLQTNQLGNDTVMKHQFFGIQDGAVFNVSVATDSATAEAVVLKVYAPALPSPRQLQVIPEYNGSYVVYWKEVEHHNLQ